MCARIFRSTGFTCRSTYTHYNCGDVAIWYQPTAFIKGGLHGKLVMLKSGKNFSSGSVFPDNKAFRKLRFARCLKKRAAFFGFTV